MVDDPGEMLNPMPEPGAEAREGLAAGFGTFTYYEGPFPKVLDEMNPGYWAWLLDPQNEAYTVGAIYYDGKFVWSTETQSHDLLSEGAGRPVYNSHGVSMQAHLEHETPGSPETVMCITLIASQADREDACRLARFLAGNVTDSSTYLEIRVRSHNLQGQPAFRGIYRGTAQGYLQQQAAQAPQSTSQEQIAQQ